MLWTWMNFLLSLLVGLTSGSGQFTNNYCLPDRKAIVHLFEWKWVDIEKHCFLIATQGYCGIQTSVPTEHVVMLAQDRPWWERYQPVSYKLITRSGNETEFASMVRTCTGYGMTIYVDLVFHHMGSGTHIGYGTGGSFYNSMTRDYPAVPYNSTNFYNPDKFYAIDGLPTLDHRQPYVREKIAGIMNYLIKLGVTGFRIDSAMRMPPQDLKAIYSMLDNVKQGGPPFILNEIVETLAPNKSFDGFKDLGYMTDFYYSERIAKALIDKNFSGLCHIFDSLVNSSRAVIFVDNHDTQRGRGRPGHPILTYKNPELYQMAQAFTIASNYGIPRIMSSYYFNDDEAGPPHDAEYNTLDVVIYPNGHCGNGWVCEHSWPVITNMLYFANLFHLAEVSGCQATESTVSIYRGRFAFFWMSAEPFTTVNVSTGLEAGRYCDQVSDCAEEYYVEQSGYTTLRYSGENMVALVKIEPEFDQNEPNDTATGSVRVALNTGVTSSGQTEEPAREGLATMAAVSGDVTTDTGVGEITNGEIGEVTTNVETGEVTTNAEIWEVTTNAEIGEVTTNAETGEVTTNAEIWEVTTNAEIGEVTTNAEIGEITTNAEIGEVTTNAEIGEASTNAEIGEITTNSEIGEVTTNMTTEGEVTTNVTNAGELTPTAAHTDELTTPLSTTEAATSTWKRTVILIERATAPGQDVFLRGGIDTDHRPGCMTSDVTTDPCAIPIRHRHLDMTFATPARDSWAKGDNYLDWYGVEPGQGAYNTWTAQGTPGQWTTNDQGGNYHHSLNIYGSHYWVVDVDMDCSKTEGGFFQFKAFLNGWESSSNLDAECSGDGAKLLPYHSPNHFGRCGYMNVYHWNQPACEIMSFSASDSNDVIG